MGQKINFLVRVNCMTYNHAPFIVDAMNGFAMQQTDFPFVCIIVDDASTDGEPEVIRHYLLDYFDLEDKTIARKKETDDYVLTFARHITNTNCYFAVLFLKYNHYSINKSKTAYFSEWANIQFIALCEGDDYWIDTNKLQKQVSYLESHPTCNLVYTNVNSFHQQEQRMSENFFNHGVYRRIKNTHKDFIMWGWFLAPCTWVYRNGIVKYPEKRNPSMFYGDIFLVLSLSQKGEIQYLNEVTSVYRVLEESASHSKDLLKIFSFWKRGRATRLYFSSKQSLAFRLKWLLVNESLAVRDIFKKRNYKIAKKTISMVFEEVKNMLFII